MTVTRLILVSGLVLALLSTIAHAGMLLRHRREGISRLKLLLFGGAMFLDRWNFHPSGWPMRGRLRASLVACFVFAIAIAAWDITGHERPSWR
jgi:hypothetical protein